MGEYHLKTVIPTESDARGLHYDGDLYFSTNNHLFKCARGGYSMVSEVSGTVLDFSIGERLFIVTEERMCMNNGNTTVGTLKRTFNCITTRNGLIAAGGSNVLEVWHIPTEFKFTLFKRHSRNLGHFLDITSVRFIDDHRVITTSRDCTVRIFDILDNTSTRVCNTIGIPIAAYTTNQENTEIAVVCEDGALLYYTLEEGGVAAKGRLYLGSRILASSCYLDFIAVSTEKDDEENLVVYKGSERVYGASFKHKVLDICLFGDTVAIKGPGFVGIHDLINNLFVFALDLPKIVSMDVSKELVAVGCADKKVRVYDEHRCIQVFQDANITHPIFSVHFLTNSVLCLSTDGGVSVWDVKNGVCYRSFKIPVRVSASEVSGDGLLLFMADFNQYTIRVVDLQRSKEIDALSGHSGPIFRMKCDNDTLYSLSYDNSIRKWNVYSQTMDGLEMERMATGFAVRNNKLCVATEGELTIYDKHFGYEKGIKVSLRARKRNEIFVSEKPVEYLDFTFDGRYIVAGGESNTIKILSTDTGDVVQSLRVSSNKEWENYKERLGRESAKAFDKTKIIEVLKIAYSSSRRMFFVLTRAGVSIYEVSSARFSPVSLDVSLTPEAVRGYLNDGEYLKAAIGSLRINQYEIIKDVILSCPANRVEEVVKYLDPHLIENLRLVITQMLDSPMYHPISIRWLQPIVFYFGSSKTSRSEIHKLRRSIGTILRLGRQNRSMLLNIIRK